MTREQKERMDYLVSFLAEASKAYYQLGTEIISNYEYDKLYDELVELENKTGIIYSKSVTQKVGYEILSSFEKEKHPKKMLSLDKTKSIEDLKSWLKNKTGFLSWKLDGLTIVLTYNEGKLIKAVTRGNGEIGEVITENAKFFKGVPKTIPFNGNLVVRGEALISYSDFEKINEAIENPEDKYKNPRNLCAGTVRQLDTKITAERNVQFIPFTLVSAEGIENNSYGKRLEWLKELGFSPVEGEYCTAVTIEELIKTFEEKVKTNDFPSDGLVLFFDDIKYGESLGETSKFPRNGIAFKWKDELATTILREIEWSASRTGLLNPVAIFDSVELEGTTVSRASVHNVNTIESLKLNIGDELTIFKANMIIPQVAENLTGEKFDETLIPSICPVCKGKTEVRSNYNPSTKEEIKTLYCTNPDCVAKHVGSFVHFVGRDAMNIVGLSEATLEKFISLGYIKKYSDLYHLSDYKDEIINLEGFGKKSYENLVKAIDASRNVDVNRFLYSFGIENIGRSASKLLLQEYNSDLDALRKTTVEELSTIDGIGEIMAQTLVDYFANPKNNEIMDLMLKEVTLIPLEKVDTGSSIAGKTFVITGSLNNYSRKELKDLIESKGGKVTGSVTGKTDYLINNDSTSNSTKNKTAKELGVKIITESEFEQL